MQELQKRPQVALTTHHKTITHHNTHCLWICIIIFNRVLIWQCGPRNLSQQQLFLLARATCTSSRASPSLVGDLDAIFAFAPSTEHPASIKRHDFLDWRTSLSLVVHRSIFGDPEYLCSVQCKYPRAADRSLPLEDTSARD